MDETNQNSNPNVVLQNHSAKKHNWKHVVHRHFPVVITCLTDCPVLDQVAKTIPHWNEGVVKKSFDLRSEGRILKTISDVSASTKIPR